MHSIELARIAAVVAAQGPSLILIRPAMPAEAMVQYWSASRQRFDLWNQGLGRFNELDSAGRSLAIRDWWQDHLVMIEEILISEILTRVMAAIGAALDCGRAEGDVEPITQSVYLTHLEARNRVLRLLLFGRGGSVEEALRLNRLRRCVERWTDFLLGTMVKEHSLTLRYAHDTGRVKAFADEVALIQSAGDAFAVNWLTGATLQTSLAALSDQRPALPQANRNLGRSVLACMRPELFDSLGLLKSTKTHRIQKNLSPEGQPDCDGATHVLFHSVHRQAPSPNLVRWTF
jgi:hypothetical protein